MASIRPILIHGSSNCKIDFKDNCVVMHTKQGLISNTRWYSSVDLLTRSVRSFDRRHTNSLRGDCNLKFVSLTSWIADHVHDLELSFAITQLECKRLAIGALCTWRLIRNTMLSSDADTHMRHFKQNFSSSLNVWFDTFNLIKFRDTYPCLISTPRERSEIVQGLMSYDLERF